MNVLPPQPAEQVSDADIRDIVATYLTHHPAEEERLAEFLAALGADGLTSRRTTPGHVTTGALVVDREGRLLQIAHKSLSRWLNPGGHVEPAEDRTLLAAALRELHEETGLNPGTVTVLGDPDLPLGIDVHRIPANPAKSEPEHWHFDFRYAFLLRDEAQAGIELQLEEVEDHRWIPVAAAELGPDGAKLEALIRGLRETAGR